MHVTYIETFLSRLNKSAETEVGLYIHKQTPLIRQRNRYESNAWAHKLGKRESSARIDCPSYHTQASQYQ